MKFRTGEFSLEDEPRSGKPSGVNDEVLRCVIRANPMLSSVDAGFKLVIYQTTASEYIKRGLVLYQSSAFGATRIKRKIFDGSSFHMCSKSRW